MYFQILKKDLKRKKTMNVILLIFIILASTFISCGANNILSVMTALDHYFDKAGVPDYTIAITDEENQTKFEDFTAQKGYTYKKEPAMYIDFNDILINGKKAEHSNSLSFVVSDFEQCITTLFDKDNQPLTKVSDGEIYVTSDFFNRFDLEIGDKIRLADSKESEFTVAGYTKDALFGSAMVGQTRSLLSPADYSRLVGNVNGMTYNLYGVHCDDTEKFNDDFLAAEIHTMVNFSVYTLKMMYIMDIITSAVLLIVSICLIVISLVILRFTIVFTMNEEFREIGVMKAIGLKPSHIRGLYITKYFAISVVGGIAGLVLSIPFGRFMLKKSSQNLVIDSSANTLLNILSTVAVIFLIVGFCYFTTRKINKFKPVDAIRNGSNGERFKGKGIIRLSRGRLAPIPFMALNDIFSGLKRFGILILIFAIGVLLIIIPINTLNTLKSDNLITWFSMAKCDVCLANELFNQQKKVTDDELTSKLEKMKETLTDKGIPADIFSEHLFTLNVSYKNKKCASLAFQGMGDIDTDKYVYMSGSAPKLANEVAITHIVSKIIGAGIGDEITIQNGQNSKKYLVTAIYQSMNNMGQGIRFSSVEKIDESLSFGTFATQIQFTDSPDQKEVKRRMDIIKKLYPDATVQTPGDYVSSMIGDNTTDVLEDIRYLIVPLVVCINILVTVLMVKTFITREKGEIGMLKALGFTNGSLVAWQTLRIAIVIMISVVIGTLVSTPLSEISSGQVFKVMGAAFIEFTVVPLEIYVVYPLILLTTTVIAASLTATGVRKIPATETTNIE